MALLIVFVPIKALLRVGPRSVLSVLNSVQEIWELKKSGSLQVSRSGTWYRDQATTAATEEQSGGGSKGSLRELLNSSRSALSFVSSASASACCLGGKAHL